MDIRVKRHLIISEIIQSIMLYEIWLFFTGRISWSIHDVENTFLMLALISRKKMLHNDMSLGMV